MEDVISRAENCVSEMKAYKEEGKIVCTEKINGR